MFLGIVRIGWKGVASWITWGIDVGTTTGESWGMLRTSLIGP